MELKKEEIDGMNKVDKKMKRFKCAFSKKRTKEFPGSPVVQSLVGELRSHKLQCEAKKTQTKTTNKQTNKTKKKLIQKQLCANDSARTLTVQTN